MFTQSVAHSSTRSLLARSDVESLDPKVVQSVIFEDMTLQYIDVALLTILVYHSIITMDKEVKYFWSRPCNSVSLIYFTNRYIGLLSAICLVLELSFTQTLARCKFALWTGGITSMLTIFLIDYILLIRVLALYDRDRKLAICLGCLLGLEAVAGFGLYLYGKLFEDIGIASITENIDSCQNGRDPPAIIAILAWVIVFVYGLILFCLVLYKAREYWKQSPGLRSNHLVRILLQDQIFYYCSIVLCCILQAIGYCIGFDHPLVGTILSFAGSRTFLCILGGQLLINLKEAAREEPVVELSFGYGEEPAAGQVSGQEVSEIRFA